MPLSSPRKSQALAAAGRGPQSRPCARIWREKDALATPWERQQEKGPRGATLRTAARRLSSKRSRQRTRQAKAGAASRRAGKASPGKGHTARQRGPQARRYGAAAGDGRKHAPRALPEATAGKAKSRGRKMRPWRGARPGWIPRPQQRRVRRAEGGGKRCGGRKGEIR